MFGLSLGGAAHIAAQDYIFDAANGLGIIACLGLRGNAFLAVEI